MSSIGTSPPSRARGSRNTSRERSGWRHVRPWRRRGCRSSVSARLQLVLAAVSFSTAGAAIKWCAFGEAQVAANSVFLQAANPLFVVALAPWLLHERVRAADHRFMAVLALGLGLLFSGLERRFATAPDPLLGNLLGAGSAVAWAFTVMGYRWLACQAVGDPGVVAAAAAIGNLIVFFVCLPWALPLMAGRPGDWLVVIYLGVFQLGLAYVFLSRAIGRISALDASLSLLAEPVLSPLWAWLVHRETPGPMALVGGAVILGATAAKSWRDSRLGAVRVTAG